MMVEHIVPQESLAFHLSDGGPPLQCLAEQSEPQHNPPLQEP